MFTALSRADARSDTVVASAGWSTTATLPVSGAGQPGGALVVGDLDRQDPIELRLITVDVDGSIVALVLADHIAMVSTKTGDMEMWPYPLPTDLDTLYDGIPDPPNNAQYAGRDQRMTILNVNPK